MKDTTVAPRYAKALFLLLEQQAQRRGQPLLELLDGSLADLRGVAEVVRPTSRVGGFLANPQVRPGDKRRVLKAALEGHALPGVTVFADLLLRKNRLNLADEIAREFQALFERAKGLQRATVVSAVALTDAETKRLHAELERSTGKKIVLDAKIDPELLGGAFVRLGDRVVDRSVATLRRAISDQLYEAIV